MTQINKIRDERGDIMTNSKIQKIYGVFQKTYIPINWKT